MPVSVALEPTTSCNLRCPECPSGLRSFTRPTGQLDPALFRTVIDELHPWLCNLTLYFQGEPFLHPELMSMIRSAADRNVFTRTSTNGHYLTEQNAAGIVGAGLDHLVISIDGVTQETYSAYRKGGRLDRVLEGARNLVQARKAARSLTPFMEFQFLVVRPNEHEIPAMRKLAGDCGVDRVTFKSAQVYDFENGSPLIPQDQRYARYRQRGDRWEIRNDMGDRCWRMWSSSVITWDGRVLPCCFDKDAHHVLGRLPQRTFREVWTDPAYQSFRETIFRSRSSVDICRNCTEGLKLT